jgi:CheY-like chemotaxis protein
MSDHYASPILIVEDLPADALLIARAFKKAKIATPLAFVTDGQQAIDYLSGAGSYSDRSLFPLPFLMLLDLKLPVRDGFEVLEWIRQQVGMKRLPTVILTSSSRSPDVNRAYDLGANSYLVKPVEDDSLVSIFRQLNMYWVLLNKPPKLTLGQLEIP